MGAAVFKCRRKIIIIVKNIHVFAKLSNALPYYIGSFTCTLSKRSSIEAVMWHKNRVNNKLC